MSQNKIYFLTAAPAVSSCVMRPSACKTPANRYPKHADNAPGRRGAPFSRVDAGRYGGNLLINLQAGLVAPAPFIREKVGPIGCKNDAHTPARRMGARGAL